MREPMALDLVAPGHGMRALGAVAAALDVGVSKTVCLAAPLGLAGGDRQFLSLELVGAGMQGAAGADFDACARAIRIAVDEAERGAETSIEDVAVCYSGPGISSRIVCGQAQVRGHEIGVREAQAALAAAIQSAPAPGRCALHVVPLAYSVDGGPATSDPRGRRGSQLSVEACIVTAPASAVEALRACVRAAILSPKEVVAAPYAAALAATTEEERAEGVLTLDLGAGGTGVACLCAEGLAFVEHVPMGGARMTKDLARKLATTFAAAERAKILHGVVGGHFDPREALEAPRLGRDGRLEAQIVSRADFCDTLGPRFQEILLLARARVAEARLASHRAPRRAVITGGGAQVGGAREAAAEMLGMPVRIGRPIGVLEESARAGPAFAAAAGLLRWRLDRPPDAAEAHSYEPGLREVGAAACAAASRAWSWLKDNF